MNSTSTGRSERIFAMTGSLGPVSVDEAFYVFSRRLEHTCPAEDIDGRILRLGAGAVPEFGAFAFKALPLCGREGLWISAHLDARGALFDQVWPIYLEAFSDFERRSVEEQRAVMPHPNYRFSAVLCDNKVAGLLGWWALDGFLFVEHFAIGRAARSGGLGRRALAALQAHARVPVLVDVEPFGSDPMAARRIAFYQRQGFCYCGIPVTLPPYRGKPLAPSNFMAWPCALDEKERGRCLATIQRTVYGE